MHDLPRHLPSWQATGPDRRRFLAGTAAATLLAGLGAPALAQARPLRIGMVTSLSGPFTALGESMRAGFRMLLEEAGNLMAGRPVELLVEDDAAGPEEGVRKARKLLGQDRVDVLCGVVSSGVELALRDVVTEAKVPSFLLGSADSLARTAASPFVVRPTRTSWMLGSTAARWLFERVAKARVLTVASDDDAGREYVGDFLQAFRQLGGQPGRQLWAPLGSADLGPMLTDIAAERPDAVCGFFAGSDAVRFLRQWKESGLAGRLPLVGTGSLFDQEDVLPATGDAALGAFNTSQQSPTAPSSAVFARDYAARTGKLPGEFSTGGYVCAQVIRLAVERAGGDLSNWERARASLFAAPVDTALGPMTFDPRNGQAVLDIHVNEVKRDGTGRIVNTVVHTYPAVRDPGLPS